jgi:hypothetical protein
MLSVTTREDVQALLDLGNHPLVLVREYIKTENREGAEAALELGSGPSGRLSGVQQVSLRRSIDARFPEIEKERQEQRSKESKEMRSDLGSALAARREARKERANALLRGHKPSRGPLATQPHISELETDEVPVFGLRNNKRSSR